MAAISLAQFSVEVDRTGRFRSGRLAILTAGVRM